MFGIGQIPNGKALNDLDIWLDEAPAWDYYVDLEETEGGCRASSPDSGSRLPENPSRNNYSYGCVTEADDDLPGHLDRCGCSTHTGVCQECGYKITVGPSGREYGHARATNRGPDEDGVRRDCTHRPLSCNPGEPHAWDGYDVSEEVPHVE